MTCYLTFVLTSHYHLTPCHYLVYLIVPCLPYPFILPLNPSYLPCAYSAWMWSISSVSAAKLLSAARPATRSTCSPVSWTCGITTTTSPREPSRTIGADGVPRQRPLRCNSPLFLCNQTPELSDPSLPFYTIN